jgi:hypothetical protein
VGVQHRADELTACIDNLAVLRAREKKASANKVPLSAPEIRHLLVLLLWRDWHGLEHLLHWSD